MITSALIQDLGNGQLEPEFQSVLSACQQRGIPVQLFPEKRLLRRQLDLAPQTLVVGYIHIVQTALRFMGIAPPAPFDYPPSLSPWLHRQIWPSSIRDIRHRLMEDADTPLFIKPRSALKQFNGSIIRTRADLAALGKLKPETQIWCSECVTWLSEYRVYVQRGAILDMRHYAGDANHQPDASVVQQALRSFEQSGAAPSAYALDFGVLSDQRTALVEANDAIGLGSYALSDAHYADMIITRWCELAGSSRR